jgi:uncharacterized membrane protein YkvA (DUF1232 family)
MRSNDIHPTSRTDMVIDKGVTPTASRTGRRSTNLFWFWLIIILAVLYIISPIDLLPDVIPVVGWIDDVVVALTAISIALPKILNSHN